MASGEQPSRGLIKTYLHRRSKKVTGGPARSSTLPTTPTDQPASHTQPATHTQSATHITSLPTPPGASSPQFYSGDPRFPSPDPRFPSPDPRFPSPDATQSTPFYPYYPPPPYGGPPAYPYPPYVPPYYPPPPPQLATGRPSSAAAAEQTTDGRMLIAPEGDTFYPSKQLTHKIRDLIRSRYDAPYVSWKKIPKEVRDMWFREFERDFCWLPQHNDKIRKNFEKRGSTRMRDMFTDLRKSGERPLWIGESVWAELNAAWGSVEYSRRRDQNRQNRASDVGGMGTSLHTGGSVPHTEHRRRLKEVLGREPTPVELHSHTHKRQEDQQWIDERARKAHEEYTRLRESQAAAGEGPSGGSVEYSEYCIWSQAVGGMQHGRVYGLGSQAQAYEGMTSSGSSFASPSQDPLYSQQISALQAELEQVRKAQTDWQVQFQAQMQAQHNQLLDEMRKMKDQLSEKEVATGDDASTDSE
ncbi:hypothetical protein M5K25_005803 [Dendrobium thyrsiflorum]|uniref:Transposase, Ptta/En/Spm, plant n=1 Tax=Dendrobium thyrsiflorum TaxID=117978 RepID=A0ABD0VQK9_DENTH